MDTLEILLRRHGFRGRARRIRCFAHTLNLTAKATLRQFEKSKNKKRTDNSLENPDFDDLPPLEPYDAENEDNADENETEMPDLEDFAEMNDEGEDEGQQAKDEEEIVNVFNTLTIAEQARWKEEVKPLRTALYKVHCRSDVLAV
jgi:hypothetical protein